MKYRDFKRVIQNNASFNISTDPEFIKKAKAEEVIVTPNLERRPPLVRIALSLSMFVVALISFFGFMESRSEFMTVSLDINPSLELSINRFGRVISVDALNEDGITLVSSLDHSNGDLGKVLLDIYETSIDLGYSDQDGAFILLGVDGLSLEDESEMSQTIQTLYSSLPIELLSIDKHAQTSLVFYSGSFAETPENEWAIEGYFDNNTYTTIMTTTTMAGAADATDPEIPQDSATDGLSQNERAYDYISLTSEQFTQLAEQLGITEAKLQIVLTVFINYSVYQIDGGIESLAEMNLSELIPLYQALP